MGLRIEKRTHHRIIADGAYEGWLVVCEECFPPIKRRSLQIKKADQVLEATCFVTKLSEVVLHYPDNHTVICGRVLASAKVGKFLRDRKTNQTSQTCGHDALIRAELEEQPDSLYHPSPQPLQGMREPWKHFPGIRFCSLRRFLLLAETRLERKSNQERTIILASYGL